MSFENLCNVGKCRKLRRTGKIHYLHDIDYENEKRSIKWFFILGVAFLLIWFVYDKPEIVDLSHSVEFFAGILAAAATILAIAFSVAQFIISRIADSYSPYIVRYYHDWRLPKLAFFSLLGTTIVAGVFLGTNIIDEQYKRVLILYTTYSFIASLIYFTNYFFEMLKIIDPMEFVTFVKKTAIRKLEEERYDDFENILLTMGDTILKTQQAKQTRLALRYIAALQILGQLHDEENMNYEYR